MSSEASEQQSRISTVEDAAVWLARVRSRSSGTAVSTVAARVSEAARYSPLLSTSPCEAMYSSSSSSRPASCTRRSTAPRISREGASTRRSTSNPRDCASLQHVGQRRQLDVDQVREGVISESGVHHEQRPASPRGRLRGFRIGGASRAASRAWPSAARSLASSDAATIVGSSQPSRTP